MAPIALFIDTFTHQSYILRFNTKNYFAENCDLLFCSELNCFIPCPSSRTVTNYNFLSWVTESTKRKLAFQGRSDQCNLCKSKKTSGMVKCNSCDQWQHPRCIGIRLSEYDSTFQCLSCKGGKQDT